MLKQMFLIILSALTLITTSRAQNELSGRDIVEKSQQNTKIAGTEAVSTLTIIDNQGRERVRKIAQVSKLTDNGNTEKKLVRFLEPADVKGTGLLTFDYEDKDDDMWLYMPALRKTRRIVSSEKSKNFMGSEFTYADMSPPSLDDFIYEKLQPETLDGEACYVVNIIAKNDEIADENGFHRRVVWISKEDFVIRKAVYYDYNDERLKVLTVKAIKELDPENDKYRPTHMIMGNVQNGRKSILKVNEIQFNPDVKDSYFTTSYLERG